MEKKVRLEIRLSPAERLKLSALAAQSRLTESEVLRTLITSGQVIEKPSVVLNEQLSDNTQKLTKIEGTIEDMHHAFIGLIEAVTARLEAMESVLVESLSSPSNYSPPVKIQSHEDTQSSPQELELPTLAEFTKQYQTPQMPSQQETFKEMVKSEYVKKYGRLPTS